MPESLRALSVRSDPKRGRVPRGDALLLQVLRTVVRTERRDNASAAGAQAAYSAEAEGSPNPSRPPLGVRCFERTAGYSDVWKFASLRRTRKEGRQRRSR